MEDLNVLVQELVARVDALEAENATLRRGKPRAVRGEGGFVSRRSLLRMSGAAAGVAAGAVLLRPQSAGATTAAMQFGATNDAGASLTELTSSAAEQTLLLTNTNAGSGTGLQVVNTGTGNLAALARMINVGGGAGLEVTMSNGTANAVGIDVGNAGTAEAIRAHNTNLVSNVAAVHGIHEGPGAGVVGEVTTADGGPGVFGYSIDGGGIVGVTGGSAPAVGGIIDFGASGAAVTGWGADASTSGPAVEAHHDGLGHAVYAHIENAHNNHRAVYGRTVGTGAAILAGIVNAASSAAALQSSTTGTGAGVDAASAKGVGGKFTGKTAQARLVPAAATSHPTSGTAGDLFVDAAKRLWFCRGGTSWRQLA
jgi:hypothetical protein